MRALALLLLAACSYGFATDRMVRSGFYSRDIYRECMESRGSNPDDYAEHPGDDRACLDVAGDVYSGDRAAAGGVFGAAAKGASDASPATATCRTFGNTTTCTVQ